MYKVNEFIKSSGSINDYVEKDDKRCKEPTEYNILNKWIRGQAKNECYF